MFLDKSDTLKKIFDVNFDVNFKCKFYSRKTFKYTIDHYFSVVNGSANAYENWDIYIYGGPIKFSEKFATPIVFVRTSQHEC